MNVLSEQVPAQERAAAVRLHEELDGRLFLRLAAEDLGDDALELSPETLVEQPRAPVDQRVAAHDQGGHAADSPQHQLARDDGRAVSPAELGPGKQVREHDSHRARRRRAQRHPPQVEAVISDRQPVALRRLEQVLARDSETVEFDPVVMQPLQREKPVLNELELVVLVVRQVDDQHGRLLVDPAYEPDRAAWHDVGDE